MPKDMVEYQKLLCPARTTYACHVGTLVHAYVYSTSFARWCCVRTREKERARRKARAPFSALPINDPLLLLLPLPRLSMPCASS